MESKSLPVPLELFNPRAPCVRKIKIERLRWQNIHMGRHTDPTSHTMYCYGANSQSQNLSTLKTRNTFNATAMVPTNSANMMCATKIDREPPQVRNAALIAK